MQRSFLFLFFAENVLFRSIAVHVLNIMLFQSLFIDACLYIVTLTKKTTVSKKQDTALCSLVL